MNHLDQIIELERGEPGLLWWAVAGYGQRMLTLLNRQGLPAVVPAGVVLALPTLERVARRLRRIKEREEQHMGLPRRKPTKFRMKADELVAIVCYVMPAAHEAAWVPLGKVQQKSLNLEQYLRFG